MDGEGADGEEGRGWMGTKGWMGRWQMEGVDGEVADGEEGRGRMGRQVGEEGRG